MYHATDIMTGSPGDSREVIRENMAQAFAGARGLPDQQQAEHPLSGNDAAIVVTESGILFGGQTEVPDEGKVNATWVF